MQTALGTPGKASTTAFDGLDRVTSTTDAVGGQTTYAFDSAGNQVSVTRPNGHATGASAPAFTTVNTFNAANDVTETVAGVPGALQASIYSYDPDGNEIISQQVANAHGDSCQTTDGCKQTVTTYDGRDLPWTTTTGGTTADRRTTLTEYDQNGDLRRTVENAGVDPSTKLPYQTDDGAANAPTAVAQLDATVRAYDPSGFKTETYLPWGCSLSANAGHIACDPQSVPAQNQHRYREDYQPDPLGRTKLIRAPNEWLANTDGTTNTYAYYPDGWVNTDTQATTTGGTTVPGRVDSYTYDQRGNETAWTATPPAASGTNGFTDNRAYYRNGLLDTLCGDKIDANTCQRGPYVYKYDADHNLTELDEPEALAGTTLPAVTTSTVLGYDAADRLLTTDVTRPTDPTGQAAVGGAGDTKLTYDADGNVTTRQTDGTLSGSTYNGDKSTAFVYDPLDREQLMTVTPATPTGHNPVRQFASTYSAAGLTATRTITQQTSGAAPVVESRSYSDDARLTQLTKTTSPAESQAYTYDVNGNTTTDEQGTHQYNPQHQETQWTRGANQPNPGSAVTYTLDGSGALTKKVDTAPIPTTNGNTVPGTTTTTYARTGDQITGTTAQITGSGLQPLTLSQAFCYDGLGNLTKLTGPPAGSPSGATAACTGQTDDPTATTTYTYNAFAQLASSTNPDNTPGVHGAVHDSYTYDGIDRRDTKTEARAGTQTVYLSSYIALSSALSRETAPPATTGATATDVRSYDYNSTMRPAGFTDQTAGTPAQYMPYALEGNGSTQALINANATIDPHGTYYYDPYGDTQNSATTTSATGLSTAAQDNPVRYQGLYLDAGAQTYDTPAREYRPNTPTYLTQDRYESASGDLNLISDPLTNNRYAYAGGNPTSNTDYNGHAVELRNPFTGAPCGDSSYCTGQSNRRICYSIDGGTPSCRYLGGNFGSGPSAQATPVAPTGTGPTQDKIDEQTIAAGLDVSPHGSFVQELKGNPGALRQTAAYAQYGQHDDATSPPDLTNFIAFLATDGGGGAAEFVTELVQRGAGLLKSFAGDALGVGRGLLSDILGGGVRDAATQATEGDPLEQAAQAARETLGVASRRNVAVAAYDIDGEAGDLTAVSGQASRAGTVGVPESPIFEPAAGEVVRPYDAEYKLLEDLGARTNADSTGSVELYTEREPCPACSSVIQQFQAARPGISLSVRSGG